MTEKPANIFAAQDQFPLYNISFEHIASNATVTFPGILVEWSDRYTSDWKQEMVFGRMDPIEIFEGTRREIGIGWSVVAYDLEEAQTNLQKVSMLANMLYPTYKIHGATLVDGYQGVNASISSSPLLKMNFTNLVTNAQQSTSGEESIDSGGVSAGDVSTVGLVGRMDGLSITPELEVGFIPSTGGKLLPKVITLSCTYYVLHTHMLGWDAGEKKKAFNTSFPYDVPIGGGVLKSNTADQAAASGPGSGASSDPSSVDSLHESAAQNSVLSGTP